MTTFEAFIYSIFIVMIFDELIYIYDSVDTYSKREKTTTGITGRRNYE